MKYLLLGIIGAVVLYEVAAFISKELERHNGDMHEDARKHRMRLLNQTGTLPNEISY